MCAAEKITKEVCVRGQNSFTHKIRDDVLDLQNHIDHSDFISMCDHLIIHLSC